MLTARWSVGIATMNPVEGVVVPAPGKSVVWPVHLSKNLRMYEICVLFCTAVKYIATSSLHELRSQTVALSADEPGMLHGEDAEQICIDLTGSALAGP